MKCSSGRGCCGPSPSARLASRPGHRADERRSNGAVSPRAGWHFLRRPGLATPQVGAGWDNGDGTNDATGGCMGREIQERSYRFGRDVMRYAVECESRSVIGRELLRQLFRSATSVGANLQEAQAASSRPDFIHKVGIARKEAFEARHWLRLRRDMCPADDGLPALQAESNELCRILSSILISARRNDARRSADRLARRADL